MTFVVERAGTVRVLRGGDRRRGAFLDIRGRVACCSGEEGLFSIAFPDFDRSRRFYVYYTDNGGDIHVDQFRRRRGRPLRAAPGTHRTVIEINHPVYSNHNGGPLQFGPDGRLYIGTGDGGGADDPDENGQDRSSLLGKLLRINPVRQPSGRPYGIPASNPYVDGPGRDEIYARGLRNPWRFAFDRRRIVIADVGQSLREEVNYETLDGLRRANFGWDVFEGTLRHEPGTLSRHDRPIHQYSHSGGRCSITGGYVVRDRRLRSLHGRYLYGDYCLGQLRSLIPDTGGARDDRPLGLRELPGLTSFGTDDRRRVYVARASGPVYRIVPD